jgi:abequosyltransferase
MAQPCTHPVFSPVRMARGQFCWLFSDDDRMEPEARAVLKELREPELTGLTTGRISYDATLSQRLPMHPLKQTETVVFTDAEQAFLKLLDRLGFLSCQIVNRKKWNAVVESENLGPYFAGYVQLYIIARMLTTPPRWKFSAHDCVSFRSDNDSFRILGMFGRLKMDVCGYEQIIGDVFGRESKVYRQSMAEIATTHARHLIINAKRPLRLSFFPTIVLASILLAISSFWLKTLPILLTPTLGSWVAPAY